MEMEMINAGIMEAAINGRCVLLNRSTLAEWRVRLVVDGGRVKPTPRVNKEAPIAPTAPVRTV